MPRPTHARIDLAAFRENFRFARTLSPGSLTLPVVKANAYGHGACKIAEAIKDDAQAFGVACIEEARELRTSGIEQPILILQGAYAPDDITLASENEFWLAVGSAEQLGMVTRAQIDVPIGVWLKVDTGMHRLGIQPAHVAEYFEELRQCRSVRKDIVIATHLACADDLGSEVTVQQLATFRAAVAGLDAVLSMANSAGLLGWQQSHGDWNRPGYMLYGNSPFDSPHSEADKLKPVMTLVSAVIATRRIEKGEFVGYGNTWRAARPSVIATVAIGYADGYPRHAPNGTPVLVDGQRAPLAGRVSMDMITVDVTDLPSVKPGDEVVLWGEGLGVNEVARHADTIGYELLAGMPRRTPRVYQH
jgi:alanine racemase